jgi:predicted nucleic acid-binding protein
MELPRLSKPSDRFVADTSTVINLNATQYAADILAALPERLVVVDIAAGELEDGRKSGRRDADMLAELREAGLVEVGSLGDAGERLFEKLVAGPASETLDDGEAATIAYAVEHSLGIVVDDRKARRICRERYSAVPMRCSVELFQRSVLHKTLGQERLVSAVFNALQIGRMRVPKDHIPWVVELIGDQKASACRSLPQRSRRRASGGA